jgi:hypothetical protein
MFGQTRACVLGKDSILLFNEMLGTNPFPVSWAWYRGKRRMQKDKCHHPQTLQA